MGVCTSSAKDGADTDGNNKSRGGAQNNYQQNSNSVSPSADDFHNNNNNNNNNNNQQKAYPQEYAAMREGETKEEFLERLRAEIKAKSCYYKGETNADGIPHGKGKMIYNSGDILEGQFFQGVGSGGGVKNTTFTFANGDLYFGPIENDLPNGDGKIRYSLRNIDLSKKCNYNFNTMLGGNSNNTNNTNNNSAMKGGKAGISLLNKNANYEGDVKDGRPDGFGCKNYPNFAFYKGAFSKGVACGMGTYYYPPSNTNLNNNNGSNTNSSAAIGDTNNNNTNTTSHDTVNYVQGYDLSHKKYYGEMKDDLPNGEGTITYYWGPVNHHHNMFNTNSNNNNNNAGSSSNDITGRGGGGGGGHRPSFSMDTEFIAGNSITGNNNNNGLNGGARPALVKNFMSVNSISNATSPTLGNTTYYNGMSNLTNTAAALNPYTPDGNTNNNNNNVNSNKQNINNINKYFAGSNGAAGSSDDGYNNNNSVTSRNNNNNNKILGQYQGEVLEGLPHGRGKRVIANKIVQEGKFVGGLFVGPIEG